MFKRISLVLMCTLGWVGSTMADSLDQLGSLSQADFLQLSKNVAAATHYKSMAPPEPLGILGFDVALELSATDLDEALFDAASSGGYSLDSFLVPRLHVHKGLPFNLDVGASLTSIPDSDFQILGAEIRYAILGGSVVTPALAIRGTYSLITGVDEADFSSAGVELAISKGFLNFTPYGGVGIIYSESSPNQTPEQQQVLSLADESFDQKKVFVGLNINLGLVNLGFEADATGDYETYSAKVGFRF